MFKAAFAPFVLQHTMQQNSNGGALKRTGEDGPSREYFAGGVESLSLSLFCLLR